MKTLDLPNTQDEYLIIFRFLFELDEALRNKQNTRIVWDFFNNKYPQCSNQFKEIYQNSDLIKNNLFIKQIERRFIELGKYEIAGNILDVSLLDIIKKQY
jgi:hypothetical protein